MGVESAELVKHGVNAFLALSIAFANELAGIAERVGADAAEVERGLKTETPDRTARLPQAGCCVRRRHAGARRRLPDADRRARARPDTALARGAREQRRAQAVGPADGRVARRRRRAAGSTATSIGVWGLVYKQGTDTLRRSSSVELCRELARAGAVVKAHDSAVRAVPDDLSGVLTLCETPLEAAEGASALVVETDWPVVSRGRPGRLVAAMRTPIVVDANGFLLDDARRCRRRALRQSREPTA